MRRAAAIPAWLAAALLALALAVPSWAGSGVTDTEIVIGSSTALSGPLAFTGEQTTKFGVDLAVKEINAAGGILGRKIEVETFDTQTNPGVAKALAQKAVDLGAYVVMGPVFSGSINVSMTETRRAEIPNFMGGEAANLTAQGSSPAGRARVAPRPPRAGRDR